MSKAFKSTFRQSLLPIWLLKSLTSSWARKDASLISLPFKKALWFWEMSSSITCWSLFTSTFEINLYKILQHDMSLKSPKWEALEVLGINVTKGVIYLSEESSRIEEGFDCFAVSSPTSSQSFRDIPAEPIWGSTCKLSLYYHFREHISIGIVIK